MRPCWILSVFLSLALGIVLYLFLVRGTVTPAKDGRIAVLLTDGERAMVLTEMRAFLAAVQVILTAGTQDRLEPAIAAARKVGVRARRDVPLGLIRKLPLPFKTLGLDTHRRFDQLALNAEQFGDPRQTLQELGELLGNCVGCHAAYRIDLVDAN